MALRPCPDCQTPISDLAPACVKCGRPMRAAPVAVAQAPGNNAVAAIASFIVPGLGQLAQGRLLAAFLMFVLATLLWLGTLFTLGWIGNLIAAIEAATYMPTAGGKWLPKWTQTQTINDDADALAGLFRRLVQPPWPGVATWLLGVLIALSGAALVHAARLLEPRVEAGSDAARWLSWFTYRPNDVMLAAVGISVVYLVGSIVWTKLRPSIATNALDPR